MATVGNDWYSFKGVEQLDTPTLVIYPQRAVQNIARLIKMVPSVGLLRPHVKTTKSADVTRMMIDQGIYKFKCATIAEAEMLGMCQAKDVLLAYQPVLTKLQRLVKLIAAYPNTQFSCLVDNIKTAEMISAYAQQNEISISVFVDLNVGMDRTGIRPELAFDLYAQLLNMPGITLLGLHAYDGHINDVSLDERIQHCEVAFAEVDKLRQKIKHYGYDLPLLVAGGSPTCTIHAHKQHV